MKTTGFIVSAPSVPGAVPTEQSEHRTLADARIESRNWHSRKDLKAHDVRIDRALGPKNGSRDNPDGRERVFVEYAGPTR